MALPRSQTNLFRALRNRNVKKIAEAILEMTDHLEVVLVGNEIAHLRNYGMQWYVGGSKIQAPKKGQPGYAQYQKKRREEAMKVARNACKGAGRFSVYWRQPNSSHPDQWMEFDGVIDIEVTFERKRSWYGKSRIFGRTARLSGSETIRMNRDIGFRMSYYGYKDSTYDFETMEPVGGESTKRPKGLTLFSRPARSILSWSTALLAVAALMASIAAQSWIEVMAGALIVAVGCRFMTSTPRRVAQTAVFVSVMMAAAALGGWWWLVLIAAISAQRYGFL